MNLHSPTFGVWSPETKTKQQIKRRFYYIKYRDKSKAYYQRNKLKIAKQQRKWHKVNKHRRSITNAENYARRVFGISRHKWIALRKKPCQICGKRRKVMNVDHKIKGTYRGTLCSLCNSRLGWYEKWQKQIQNYLQ